MTRTTLINMQKNENINLFFFLEHVETALEKLQNVEKTALLNISKLEHKNIISTFHKIQPKKTKEIFNRAAPENAKEKAAELNAEYPYHGFKKILYWNDVRCIRSLNSARQLFV